MPAASAATANFSRSSNWVASGRSERSTWSKSPTFIFCLFVWLERLESLKLERNGRTASHPFSPRGEGRDEGAPAVRSCTIVTPSPRPSPLRGEGVKRRAHLTSLRIDPNRPMPWPTIQASPIVPRSIRRRPPRLKPAHHLLMWDCAFTRLDGLPLAIKLGNLVARRSGSGTVNRVHFGDEIGDGQAALGSTRLQRRGGRFVDFNLVFHGSHGASMPLNVLVIKTVRRPQ